MNKSPRASITGYGSAIPDRLMTNFDFEKFLDTSDEWITKRTGVKERRILPPDQGATSELATEAGRKALEDAGITAKDLDLIICATISPDMLFPASACFVQDALGAVNSAAFDLSAACSGFVYGLSIASQFMETRKYSKILVIGADVLSRHADYTDRSSCILFGDGAGAVVLEPSGDSESGIIYSVMKTRGSGWDFIHIPAGGSRSPITHELIDQGQHKIKMKGRDIYKFAVEKMQWVLGDCMQHCDLSVDDIDLIVPHQVNIRIIQSAVKKYNFPMEKVYVNIDRRGNTSGASVPLALDEAVKEGVIGPGSTIILVAFGAGLTWAGATVRL